MHRATTRDDASLFGWLVRKGVLILLGLFVVSFGGKLLDEWAEYHLSNSVVPEAVFDGYTIVSDVVVGNEKPSRQANRNSRIPLAPPDRG